MIRGKAVITFDLFFILMQRDGVRFYQKVGVLFLEI